MYIGGMSAGEDVRMPADFREVAFRDTCAKTKTENVVIVTEKQMFDSMEYYVICQGETDRASRCGWCFSPAQM